MVLYCATESDAGDDEDGGEVEDDVDNGDRAFNYWRFGRW